MSDIREGYKETEIGIIPEEWDVAYLKDIVEFHNGKAHEKVVEDNGDFIIVNSKFVSTEGRIKKYTNSCIFPLRENDIVMVMSDVPNGKAIAKTFLIENNNKYTLNQRIGCFRNAKGNVFYLNYAINRNKYYLKFDDGVKQTNLRKDDVLGLPLQIPPLKEQEKIAEILSTTDSHIEKMDKLIEDYELLKKGMMQKLLTEGIGHTEFKDTEIGRIPKEWEVLKLGDITEVITKGTTPSTYGFDFTNNGVNFIKVENVDDTGFIDINSTPKISNECNDKLSRSSMEENDIVVSIAGTIGRSAIIKKNYLPANTNQALAIVRINKNIEVDVNYVNYTFSSINFRRYVDAIRTVGAQPNMSLKQVKDTLIPFPKIREQKSIANYVDSISSVIYILKQERLDLGSLKQALMDRLLTGKVRVV